MSSSTEVLIVKKITPAYWRTTFSNGPLNLFQPETYIALKRLATDLENDKDVRVVVFDSDSPEYFIAHFDMLRGMEEPEGAGTGVISDWGNFVMRLVRLPVVSVAAIAGRVRGHGNEFINACDVRFASRERSIFSQPEVGAGVTPGGGGFEWLTRNVGRSRAIEIILGSDDFDGTTAELYGWINRAIPHKDFEAFVDRFARRIAGFDKRPLIEAKRVINARAGVPTDVDLLSSMALFVQSCQWPSTSTRIKALFERGLQQNGEGELNLGDILGQITAEDLQRISSQK
ncbi:hypothetical protein B7463_g4600, partial [Scytalidium lignicola]